MSDFTGALTAISGAGVERGVRMERLTTLRVGGPVDYLVTASNRASVAAVLQAACEAGKTVTIIGNGSDVLVSDAGLEGVAMRMAGELAELSVRGTRLEAGAGVTLGSAARLAALAGLSGLEFAAGIPGTVGGATMTNAGAFGGCWADVTERVETLNRDGATEVRECFDRAYRAALVPADEVVIGTVLALRSSEVRKIERRMRAFSERRRASQPQGLPTAGSVFKNPPTGSAGRMIEECGLKGADAGGACISMSHANFIVNRGGATASDILRLIYLARESVLARFGVELELEVRLLGFTEE